MKFLIINFLILISSGELEAAKIPADQKGSEFKIDTNIYYKITKNDILRIAIENFNRLERRKTQSFGVFYNRKFTSSLGFYAAYEKKYGERFDEDWEKMEDGWFWRDSESRGVNWGFLGGSYRTRLESLPGDNWSLNLRGGLKYNFHNQQNSFQLNPTLTFFEYSDARLKRSYFWQSDIFYSLNFAKNNIYRWYSYFGVMFHLKKDIALGGYVGRSFYRWYSTEQIENKIQTSYEATNSSNIFGLKLTLKI